MSAAGRSHLWRMILTAMETAEFYQPHLEYLKNIPEDEDSITFTMHNTLVDRLRSWNRFYVLSSETFFLAVSVMDRFLSLVKARPHHLMCVTAASYYLSVKMLEHSQDLMSPEDLVRITQCGCTASDIARMENIILQKLGWDLEAPTPLSFLQLFHAYCVVSDILGTDAGKQTDHLDIMTRKLEACMCHFPLTLFKPSILAMSLLISELPDFIHANCDGSQGWSRVLAGLQYSMKMSDCELLECQTVLSDFLTSYSSPECKMPTSRLSWVISSRTARQMRFSAQLSSTLTPIPEHEGSLTDESWSDSSSSLSDTTESQFDESHFPTTLSLQLPETLQESTAPSCDTKRDKCLLWENGVLFRFESEKMAFCPLVNIHAKSER